MVRREPGIIGSMIYQTSSLRRSGSLRPARWGAVLSQTFPLARIDEAFEAHRSPDSIKVAVIP